MHPRSTRNARSPAVQGNNISSLDDVQFLSALPCLRHLQLQNPGRVDRNPMCDHPAYRTAVRRMLPALQSLDAERILLADAALPKDVSSALSQLTFTEPEPWLKGFDWGSAGAEPAVPTLGPLKGAAEFDASLTECKRLSAKAQALLDDYNCRTPR
jgi:hypothetical protein